MYSEKKISKYWKGVEFNNPSTYAKNECYPHKFLLLLRDSYYSPLVYAK
jgi:hypothetical protein